MPPRRIDYYFSLTSPWSYLGHVRFGDLARRHDLAVAHKPINLPDVFAETGGLPLARRSPARQRYRMLELQRWRIKLAMPFHLKPRHWPFDPRLADGLAIAVVQAGCDPDAFLRRAFAAVWEEQLDLADGRVLTRLAADAGLDADPLLEAAKGADVAARYAANGRAAVVAGVIGAPSYVLDGEVFWGQDRLDLLADALASGRPALSADVPEQRSR